MRGVEERERGVLAGLGGGVVAQVGGEVGVHARRAYGVEEAVPRAAAHGDGTDQTVAVPGGAYALCGDGQPRSGQLGELGQRQRPVQLADPAQSPASFGVGGVGDEGADDAQAECASERVGDTGVGGVGVGVRGEQRDTVLDQGVYDTALEGVGRDGGGAAQVQRVVGDEEFGTESDGLVGDLPHGVDGEQHAGHACFRVRDLAAHRSDGVPLLRAVARPQGVKRCDDIGE